MNFWNDKKNDKLSRSQLVNETLKYFEDANRDADEAKFTEKFTFKGLEYTVSISCTVRKAQS
jgi:hypothetical protein